eukprot:scaffold329622_cov23-Prasinocladus_malaysianus.AAC.1
MMFCMVRSPQTFTGGNALNTSCAMQAICTHKIVIYPRNPPPRCLPKTACSFMQSASSMSTTAIQC